MFSWSGGVGGLDVFDVGAFHLIPGPEGGSKRNSVGPGQSGGSDDGSVDG